MLLSLLATALLVISPAAPDTTTPEDPELAQLLLTLDDMPTGWALS